MKYFWSHISNVQWYLKKQNKNKTMQIEHFTWRMQLLGVRLTASRRPFGHNTNTRVTLDILSLLFRDIKIIYETIIYHHYIYKPRKIDFRYHRLWCLKLHKIPKDCFENFTDSFSDSFIESTHFNCNKSWPGRKRLRNTRVTRTLTS